MTYKNKEDQKRWLEATKDKKREYDRKRYLETRGKTITKRCPADSCNKQLKFKKFYISRHPEIVCEHCGVKIKIGKTLSANHKNAYGIKLMVAA